ncbi:hypothetical protein MNBD_UNCLBAC01-823 [hydrothermal vent metagenome]|uniref:Uncharacterized protein n=1 Tax=hydrothermal vent metagenome TaxID=652676 RepID=A0A3B1CZW7_9ZZZZ
MKKGRQKKIRYIQKMPQIVQFSPRGKPGRPDEIELQIDQFEAIKLADYQGYSQIEGAEAMGLSRPSFGRILREARKIIANALVNGKVIRIRMGDAQVGIRKKNLPKKNKNASKNQITEEAVRKIILEYTKKTKKEV